jgi:thioredoxin 1
VSHELIFKRIVPVLVIGTKLTVKKEKGMASFGELIASEKPVLVDFYAEWCGPCKTMSPILKEAKDALGETATVVKIDIDRNRQAAEAFGIQGVPTLILFKKGEVKWRQSGVVPASMLVKVVQQHL